MTAAGGSNFHLEEAPKIALTTSGTHNTVTMSAIGW